MARWISHTIDDVHFRSKDKILDSLRNRRERRPWSTYTSILVVRPIV
jgi:hypothetical protein